jgi:hypothetical protein
MCLIFSGKHKKLYQARDKGYIKTNSVINILRIIQRKKLIMIISTHSRSNSSTRPKIEIKIPKNPELSAMKDGPNFCKKGVNSDLCFSSMVTPGRKWEEVILYEHVMDKNLFWFLQIHLQLTETAPAKSRTVTEK